MNFWVFQISGSKVSKAKVKMWGNLCCLYECLQCQYWVWIKPWISVFSNFLLRLWEAIALWSCWMTSWVGVTQALNIQLVQIWQEVCTIFLQLFYLTCISWMQGLLRMCSALSLLGRWNAGKPIAGEAQCALNTSSPTNHAFCICSYSEVELNSLSYLPTSLSNIFLPNCSHLPSPAVYIK